MTITVNQCSKNPLKMLCKIYYKPQKQALKTFNMLISPKKFTKNYT